MTAQHRPPKVSFQAYHKKLREPGSDHVKVLEDFTLECLNRDMQLYNADSRYGMFSNVDVEALIVQPPYTCVAITTQDTAYAGFAKRKPTDPYDPLIGISIATNRAVRNLLFID